jgi:penicillin-binding protein 1C
VKRSWAWVKRVGPKRWALIGFTGCAASLLAFALAWVAFPFPIERVDQWPSSRLVLDRTGLPLIRLVGADDQWRQPVRLDAMSHWIIEATLAVEDARFYDHHGIDFQSVGRACWQNIRAVEVVSGASTISMQVCRMTNEQPRTVATKLTESFRALQLESLYSKEQILQFYLNTAPYGRNLRGVESAARFYFGKAAADLNLAESALLAGLPQSPARLRPDRHPDLAIQRRHRVLMRMQELGTINEHQLAEADATELSLRDPSKLPLSATHAAWMALQRRPAGGVTTIDMDLQQATAEWVAIHRTGMPDRTDIAVVVIDINPGDLVALIGSADPSDPIDGQVNGATARRSPGSTLKPFVYAAAFESGRLEPNSILMDEPITLAEWSPRNFSRTFLGEVTAAEALRRSLNIPAITVANQVGLARCGGLMRAAGVDLPEGAEDKSGLAIVVGASEVTLIHLTNAYATIGRGGLHRPLRLFPDQKNPARSVMRSRTAAALDDILGSHRRPQPNISPNAPWFMWKTGTSARRRDAWAVGHNGRFAIGVWVGQFDGSTRTSYVGAQAAEPLLRSLFHSALFRSGRATPGAVQWSVPVPLGAQIAQRLRIEHPAEGVTYEAFHGAYILKPRANAEQLSWFLNGRPVEAIDRIQPGIGRHQLICTDLNGRTANVRFVVR